MKRQTSLFLALALLFLVAVACTPAPSPTPVPTPPPTAVPPTAVPAATKPAATTAPVATAVSATSAPATSAPPAATKAADSFDLDALVAAAKKEGEVVVYWHSSRIDKAGKNFEAKYGIKVKGTKMNDAEQTERVIREVDSKNIQVDVLGYEDGPTLENKFIPQGYTVNYFPSDLVNDIPKDVQNPLIYQWQPRMFGYNTEVYGTKCPIDNVWQLTEAKWKGKVIIRDPMVTTSQIGFFSEIISQSKLMEDAYKQLYGKPLETKEKNAGWEYLKRLFQNDVVLMKADGDVGDAVGAAGQKDPPIGMYTLTKHRDVKDKNLKIATCRTMQPFMGYQLPTYVTVLKNAPHPNAARLWVHYVLTPEGVAPWTVDDMGGFSVNPKAAVHPMNEGTWADWQKRLLRFDNKIMAQYKQEILDFWLQYSTSK